MAKRNNDEAILSVVAQIDEAASQKRMQSQLDKIAKKLKVAVNAAIGGTSSGGAGSGSPAQQTDAQTRAMKKYVTEINNAVHAYKTGEKGVEAYNNQLQKLLKYKNFESLSWQKQEQLVNEYSKSLKIIASNQDAVDRKKQASFKMDQVRYIQQQRAIDKTEAALAKLRRTELVTPKVAADAGVQKAAGDVRTAVGLYDPKNITTVNRLNAAMREYNIQTSRATKELASATTSGKGFFQMIKADLGKVVQWGISMSLIYGSLRKIREGIQFVMELDNSLNEIRIVTGQSQEQVESLAKSYNKLAQEMSVTTSEIVGQAADLYRQGLSAREVEERLKAITVYAKISGLTMEESNKIITAAANATGESVNKIIDIFSYLGRICPVV